MGRGHYVEERTTGGNQFAVLIVGMHLTQYSFHASLLLSLLLVLFACESNQDKQNHLNFEDRIAQEISSGSVRSSFDISDSLYSMVLIPGGEFVMGASQREFALARELPTHQVHVDSFYMDVHEVTNEAFQQFVEETGYVTVAERPIDWNALKLQLPKGTPKPPDSLLVPGSMVFQGNTEVFSMSDHSQWWKWVNGACWRHPFGPGSSLKGFEKYPVVHIAYIDAYAFAHWSGRRLPTEAEWECAARGGLKGQMYPWGNTPIDEGGAKCNYWTGIFPSVNTAEDGYAGLAPVMQFEPNAFGLYDMAGNVWEICADWYDERHYETSNDSAVWENPKGPKTWAYALEPNDPKRVMRGGSFLCNDSYCASYRVSARMPFSQETGMSHIGFRCARD
jgi:formylglycine-generating enzyme required for sulfatase activity